MLVGLGVIKALVVLTHSAPAIHPSLKFLLPTILSLNFIRIRHFNFVTTSEPPLTLISQSSYETVWHSRSYCFSHFLKVSFLTFRCLAYGSPVTTAVAHNLFIVRTRVLSKNMEDYYQRSFVIANAIVLATLHVHY